MAQKKGFNTRRVCLKKAPKDYTLLGICVMYCGTGYLGLQIQTRAPTHYTVEGVLILAMKDIGLVGAIEGGRIKGDVHRFARSCRTDRGVHAVRNMVSLFVSNRTLEALGGCERVKELLNNALPRTVRVAKITLMMGNFVPRFYCDKRVYRYLIPAYALISPCDTWESFYEKFPQAVESLCANALAGSSFIDICSGEQDPWLTALSAAVTRGNELLERYVVGVRRFHNFSVDLSHPYGGGLNRKSVLPHSNEAMRSVYRCEIVPCVFLLQRNAVGLTRAEYYAALETVNGDVSPTTSFLATATTTTISGSNVDSNNALAAGFKASGDDGLPGDFALPFVIFQIEGNSFLFNMIRKIVGTILAVVRGAQEEFFSEALSLERSVTCPLAPAAYLFLFYSSYRRYDMAICRGRTTRFNSIADEWGGSVAQEAARFAASFIAADVVDSDLNRTPACGTLLAAREAAQRLARPHGVLEDSHLAALKERQNCRAEPHPVCSEMTIFLRLLRVHNWNVIALKPSLGKNTSTFGDGVIDNADRNVGNNLGPIFDCNSQNKCDENNDNARKVDAKAVGCDFYGKKRLRVEVNNDGISGNDFLGTAKGVNDGSKDTCNGDNNNKNSNNSGGNNDTSDNEKEDGWLYLASTKEEESFMRREYHQKRRRRYSVWN